jgi:hypothetical protein
MKRSRKILLGIGVAAVVLIALTLWRCSPAIEKDSCLDMGGRWNYETQSCEGARSG